MTTEEKLKQEVALLNEITETRNQIRQTKSAMRKEQLMRHLHKLENKWRKQYG